MKAKIQHNWAMYTLQFQTSEMQAVISRCGWSIVNTFDEMTEADKAELYRLEYELKGIWARGLPMEQHEDWFLAHVVKTERIHVPYGSRDKKQIETFIEHCADEDLIDRKAVADCTVVPLMRDMADCFDRII